jgi:hypothetical protein
VSKLRRLTDQEIHDVAKRIALGEVFTSWQVSDDSLIPLVFLVLTLVDRDTLTDVGMVYEELAKAGPRSINGHPIFMSCVLVHKDDCQPLREKTLQIVDLLKEI